MRALLTLHLWLGLASGLFFSVVCGSGFFLALHPRLEARLNRDLLVRPANGGPLAPEVLLGGLCDRDGWTALQIPAEPNGAWRLRRKGSSLYLDPFTGQKLGDLRPLLGNSYQQVEWVHRFLLFDRDVGRPVCGALALVYLAIMLSGGALWLSRCARNLPRGLSFRPGVGWKRLLYDAHLVLGGYALLPLFLMAFTGLWWTYREPYKAAAYALLDGTPPPAAIPRGKPSQAPRRLDLPLGQMLESLSAKFPQPGLVELDFPRAGQSTVTLRKTRSAGFWRLPVRDEVVFDVSSGHVVEVRPFAGKTRAEQVLSLMLAVHTGVAWGDASLVLYLLATLMGFTLPLTGSVMWWNRMRGQWKARRILAARRSVDPEGPADRGVGATL
jgi:uncharacterized iron-regulated membrane protein